jgi:hypothetical protein
LANFQYAANIVSLTRPSTIASKAGWTSALRAPADYGGVESVEKP